MAKRSLLTTDTSFTYFAMDPNMVLLRSRLARCSGTCKSHSGGRGVAPQHARASACVKIRGFANSVLYGPGPMVWPAGLLRLEIISLLETHRHARASDGARYFMRSAHVPRSRTNVVQPHTRAMVCACVHASLPHPLLLVARGVRGATFEC